MPRASSRISKSKDSGKDQYGVQRLPSSVEVRKTPSADSKLTPEVIPAPRRRGSSVAKSDFDEDGSWGEDSALDSDAFLRYEHDSDDDDSLFSDLKSMEGLKVEEMSSTSKVSKGEITTFTEHYSAGTDGPFGCIDQWFE